MSGRATSGGPAGATRGGAAELGRRRAIRARDAGLRRISAITRGIVACSVALSGALALLAASGFRGHSPVIPPATPARSATVEARRHGARPRGSATTRASSGRVISTATASTASATSSTSTAAAPSSSTQPTPATASPSQSASSPPAAQAPAAASASSAPAPLQASQAPAPTPAAPVVVSGGS
jgi:hypothetical protein